MLPHNLRGSGSWILIRANHTQKYRTFDLEHKEGDSSLNPDIFMLTFCLEANIFTPSLASEKLEDETEISTRLLESVGTGPGTSVEKMSLHQRSQAK